MPLSVRVFNALVGVLFSASALLASGLTGPASGGPGRPIADATATQPAPTTLTWG